jgi:hypothetical protein
MYTVTAGHPACELSYPKPDTSQIAALAASGVIKPNDVITFFGDSITWYGGYPEVRTAPSWGV